MNSEIAIRPLTEQDAAAAAAIEEELFSQPWSAEGFRTGIAGEGNLFLGAFCGEELWGYIGMYRALDEGEITNVGVSPEKRRLGIGRALVQMLAELAKQKGVARIFLEVRDSNVPAIRLYEECGFEFCGIRKGFYDFPKEDARVMCLDLQKGQ